MSRIDDYKDPRWKQRADQIRKLDGYRCVNCGAYGRLQVHHLCYPPYPFHIWDSYDNELVTLCPICHRMAHESTTRFRISKNRKMIGKIRWKNPKIAPK